MRSFIELKGGRGDRPLLVGALLIALAGRVCAVPPSIIDVAPADAVAAYFAAGRDSTQPSGDGGSALALAAFLSDLAREVGLLSKADSSIRCWIDGLAFLPEVLAHPHAVVLLDISAKAREDGGHELANLQAALIVHTRGANAGLERRIQHLLNTYTNSNETILSTQARDGNVAFTIRDRRLPSWAEITWGQLGDHYIVALGRSAYDHVARAIA
ncbi:MAG: hypothetical protein WBE26_16170, partial [Phycisphaerae bacterium]